MEVLATVMARESSKMTMLIPGGHGSPKFHSKKLGKRLRKEVASHFLTELESYKSDMRWGGPEEGVTHFEARIGNLLDASQRRTLALLY